MSAAIMPIPKLGQIAAAIKAIYGVASELDEFIDRHIEKLKRSRNSTIARSGRVLEAAKTGFGIGYISSVTVIAAGQLLLGNTLAAAKTVATAATMTNPYVMTAAAVGAVIYGYYALSDEEREQLNTTLSAGLMIGIELVKAILAFVISKGKALFTDENWIEMKKFVADYAAKFGRTVSDVTGSIADRANETIAALKKGATRGRQVVADGVESVSIAVVDAGDAIYDVTVEVSKKLRRVVSIGQPKVPNMLLITPIESTSAKAGPRLDESDSDSHEKSKPA